MEIKTISEINEYVGTSINPIETPDELFELYSVPSYDNQYPEIIKGSAIGSTKITVQENDVLICKINPRINRVWIVKHHTPYRLLASSEWIVVRNKQINPQYLQWYFSSPPFRDKITSQVAGIGGSLTRAQPKVVANYPVPIPSLHDQNKVANSLDQLERLISLRKKQLQKLDDLVKARFVEMFGDPVSNPFGLPEKKLSELGTLDRGRSQHRPRNAPELLGGPYPLIQTGEVASAGLYITEYHNTYSEIGLKQSKMWKAGTLCITIAANIAQTAIMTFDACFPDSVVGFVPYSEVDALYMHYWFGFFQKILEEQAPQVAQKNINLKILADLNVIVPETRMLKQFATFVSQVEKSKLSIQQGLEKLETLKKSLMQQYFG